RGRAGTPCGGDAPAPGDGGRASRGSASPRARARWPRAPRARHGSASEGRPSYPAAPARGKALTRIPGLAAPRHWSTRREGGRSMPGRETRLPTRDRRLELRDALQLLVALAGMLVFYPA